LLHTIIVDRWGFSDKEVWILDVRLVLEGSQDDVSSPTLILFDSNFILINDTRSNYSNHECNTFTRIAS